VHPYGKDHLPKRRPEPKKKIRRRMTKVAQFYALASQQIIEPQSLKLPGGRRHRLAVTYSILCRLGEM
jgi:hypothetical protein